jgi:hypothetical protein
MSNPSPGVVLGATTTAMLIIINDDAVSSICSAFSQ